MKTGFIDDNIENKSADFSVFKLQFIWIHHLHLFRIINQLNDL